MHSRLPGQIPALDQRQEPTSLLMSASETLSGRGYVADLNLLLAILKRMAWSDGERTGGFGCALLNR
jgi:hypothetical protein